MTNAERDSLIAGINRILGKALLAPDPGPAVMRRLSHREYGYTLKDLLGIDFNAVAYFPTEASGGEGFDNQGGVLYVTPLLMERYYQAADSLMRQLQHSDELWKSIAPKNYRPSLLRRLNNWWSLLMGQDRVYWSKPRLVAKDIILPFAVKAYRRLLNTNEEEELLSFFEEIYFQEWKNKSGFENSLATVFKKILVSPSFLFRMEANLPIHDSYQVNNFELASRLSYLLWSSMPDETLMNVAYREDLQDSSVLRRETLRMVGDAKFKRFSETFAPQWLGIQEILLAPKTDIAKYPSFTTSLREAMHQEVVEYFGHIFSKGNLLQLIDGDFGMLNAELAQHYGIEGVEGSELRPVKFANNTRGGVLGMGAVLTATSLPLRTSPVLRGQWVLEQLLGTRVPPPPPDVPELEAAKGQVHNELDLRKLLEQHRSPSACQSCHKKMDPIGFGLENYDAIGKWRSDYEGEVAINARGELEDGTIFEGPAELRQILMADKEKFARNFSRKLLSYALGRGVGFLDTPTLDNLTDQLLDSNFNGTELVIALVNSYPFRHRRSDLADRYKDNAL